MSYKPQPRLFPALGWKWNLFFIVLALVEIYLLTLLNGRIGFANIVLLILFSAMGGVFLMRWEGNRCWNRILRELSEGKPALNSMKDGILILAGGFMLIMPGVLTDIVGLSLFFPPFRILIRYLFLKNITFQLPGSAFTFSDAFMGKNGMSGAGDGANGREGANPSGLGGVPFGAFYMGGFSNVFPPHGTPGDSRDSASEDNDFYDENADESEDSDIYDSECAEHVDSLSDGNRPIQIIDVTAKETSKETPK